MLLPAGEKLKGEPGLFRMQEALFLICARLVGTAPVAQVGLFEETRQAVKRRPGIRHEIFCIKTPCTVALGWADAVGGMKAARWLSACCGAPELHM